MPEPNALARLPAAAESSKRRRIHELRLQQESGWRQGNHRPVEEYLRQYPDLASDDAAVLDCVYGEFVLREKVGESPKTEEYYQRFPRQAELLRRLFAVDRALVGEWPSDCLPLDEGATLPSPAPSDTTNDIAAAANHPPRSGLPYAAPDVIGKYRIVNTIDAGGQGFVFRAIHPTLGRDVVIKLAREVCDVAATRNALLSEGRLLAELDHPQLARVYDFDFHQNRPYLVMEFIRGRTLEQHVNQNKMPPLRAAALVTQVARALEVAHRRGVTHRDIKPQNILIDEVGQPRVIDFGLAQKRDNWTNQSDRAGTVAGTVQFMAPEQARGDMQHIGPPTDVYALGAVLFWLLTGHAPVEGKSFYDTLERVAAGQVNKDKLRIGPVPSWLRALCLRALAHNPAERFGSAGAMADALDGAARSRTIRRFLIAAVPFALLMMALGWWLTRAPEQQPLPMNPERPTAFQYDDKAPHLTVRVADDDGLAKLKAKLPLRAGYGLQVEVNAPPALHVTLFLFDTEGKLTEVARRQPSADPLRYPGVGTTVTLAGPPGTNVLLAIGNRSGPIGLADVQPIWGDMKPWAVLPKFTVWRLMRSGVADEEGSRGFGEVKKINDPEGEVAQRLESLHGRLAERFDFFEGLAVAQQ